MGWKGAPATRTASLTSSTALAAPWHGRSQQRPSRIWWPTREQLPGPPPSHIRARRVPQPGQAVTIDGAPTRLPGMHCPPESGFPVEPAATIHPWGSSLTVDPGHGHGSYFRRAQSRTCSPDRNRCTGPTVGELPGHEYLPCACLARHLPLKCHSIEGGTRFHIRKAFMTWSPLTCPLTESNRRPSPYHLKSSRFSARQGLPRRPPASADPDLVPACGICGHSGHRTGSRVAASAGPRPAGDDSGPRLPCRSGPARGTACRPATSAPAVKRRSDDPSHPR